MIGRDLARGVAIAVPPTVAAAWLAERVDLTACLTIGASFAVSVALVWSDRQALARRLGTISSVLAAFREGDLSVRARTRGAGEVHARVLTELNELGDTLREHRLGELEAWALLRKVLGEVDVVVLAFDEAQRVRLANDAAARLLDQPPKALLGQAAGALGLAELLEGAPTRVVKDAPLCQGRPWELRRGDFRLAGAPHTLIVLSDVTSALRENERDAWRRLIRVMSHEINNSLAPIQSIAGSLVAQLDRPRAPDWDEDLAGGLGVIARRSEALGRFIAAYAALARLPPPTLQAVAIADLVSRAASLERRVEVGVRAGPDTTIDADADQLEQVLINLIKNAAEAAAETAGGVRVTWRTTERWVEIEVEDDGPGVGDTTNLFVPFFTTKQGGSGIGLVFSRQVVEAHRGELTLASRIPGPGALATLRLPRRRGVI